MKRHLPLAVFCIVIGGACTLLMMFGCCEKEPTPDPFAALNLRLIDIDRQLTDANTKLDELIKRPHIFPIIKPEPKP